MIKLLAIPVAGTVAALIALLIAHPERDFHDKDVDEGPDVTDARSDRPDIPDFPDMPVPSDAEGDENKPPPPPPPPDPMEYQLRLDGGGKFVDLETGQEFDDIAGVLKQLATDPRVRNRVILSNGAGTDEAALDKVLEKLRTTFDVRKFYSAPKDDE